MWSAEFSQKFMIMTKDCCPPYLILTENCPCILEGRLSTHPVLSGLRITCMELMILFTYEVHMNEWKWLRTIWHDWESLHLTTIPTLVAGGHGMNILQLTKLFWIVKFKSNNHNISNPCKAEANSSPKSS